MGGIGTDIVSIQRMKYILSGIEREEFLSKTFTERELRQIQQHNMPVYLATRFAGKEAVFKAFGTSWRPEDQLTDIEILMKDTGEPYVQLNEGKYRDGHS
ncbi:MAG: holo-ACP synthase [Bacillus sp. (in: firmicutes)]